MKLTKHAIERIKERICEYYTHETMCELAQLAFDKGKTPVHFIDADYNMFNYLNYRQSKYQNSIAKIYENYIFIFSRDLEPVLITCYKFSEESYKNYLQNNKKVV